MGFKEIRLAANMEVGGYAWARMGFRFESSYNRDIRVRVRNGLESAGAFKHDSAWANGLIANFDMWESYEVAALSYTNPSTGKTHRVGKNALLGSNWGAVKYLNEDDPGFIAGQLYYLSKKK